MAENTKIQWCHHTFSAWRGCTKVAAGCAHCYADAQAKRNPGVLGIWGQNGKRVVASEQAWKEPLAWNRKAARGDCPECNGGRRLVQAEGYGYETCARCNGRRNIGPHRRRVFSASMSDLFEEWPGVILDSNGCWMFVEREGLGDDGKPQWGFAGCRPLTMGDVRRRWFSLTMETENLDWLALTKRPENILDMWPRAGFPNAGAPGSLGRFLYLENVWLGTSVATQEDFDRNFPKLAMCRTLAPVLFLSLEPLLEPVKLCSWCPRCGMNQFGTLSPTCGACFGNTIRPDWVIVGGESGPNARPCHVDWVNSIVRQCLNERVPVFVKQFGAQPIESADGFVKHVMLRHDKGGDPAEWPEWAKVREFPIVRVP